MTALKNSKFTINPSYRIIMIMALSLIVILLGCSAFKKINRKITEPESFKKFSEGRLKLMRDSSPFLKVHMKNGNVYVLQNWSLDEQRHHVLGDGMLYNAVREILQQGQFKIGLDSVAIFETNVLEASDAVAGLMVFTGITAAITIYCITNSKACFGSCPTFYTSDGDSFRLEAEGFSASIAPSLEATDVDALFHASASGEEFALQMRNEALETHVVRRVNLLAVPRTSGHRIFADLNGQFWECTSVIPPISATAPEGNCLKFLLDADGNERYSRADSTYLGAKEVIELEFENIPQQTCGLIIGCRQTLLTTYLLYQTYAYMGNNVGYWIAQIERKKIKQNQNSIQKILSGIEVLIQDDVGNWKILNQVNEYGPLATDFHLVPLGQLVGRSAKIRLRMTKGNWRIDYVGLAVISQAVQAIRLQPLKVLKDGLEDDQALATLCDSTKVLISLPGDTYTLKYHMPNATGNYEFFLESQGYYLEWIRKEWIEEENPFFLAQMLFDPQTALKRLAPEFKRVEKEIEYCFWRSRYARP
ncbi:MAG: hypothetical protein ONB32_13310 [candidate division KSB1 bacterium]|nr:hypothetical protein [candidate division KSB1 bacterium]MDZ7399690.1 hypothetical protein [candidate division KSB1 bacterium]